MVLQLNIRLDTMAKHNMCLYEEKKIELRLQLILLKHTVSAKIDTEKTHRSGVRHVNTVQLFL